MDKAAFDRLGWARIPYSTDLADWAAQALPQAIKAANDTRLHDQWLRLGGTWFVGVDALGNDMKGAVNGSDPLAGSVLEAAQYAMGQPAFDWGQGQVSVCYRGYPKPGKEEPENAFRYRLKRASAHLDGLKPVGPDRKRKMEEYHGFIMGLPLNETPADAAPFVIWEGSHVIFRDMLSEAFKGAAPDDWPDIDLTDIYQATRARIFETCPRVEIHAKPGEAYIAHRFALHGMACWPDDLNGPVEGRIIAYFRPFWQRDRLVWLEG